MPADHRMIAVKGGAVVKTERASVCGWACVAAMVLCAWAPASSARAQQVLLEWVWQPGERLTYEIVESLEQKSLLDAGGIEQRQSFADERTWTFEQAVLSVNEEGVATIERVYTRLEMEHQQDGKRVATFDSDKPAAGGADHPRVKPLAAMVGHRVEFDVDRRGRVLRSEGGAALMRAITASMAQNTIAGNAAGLLGPGQAPADAEQQFQRQIEQSLKILPGRSVRRGATWDGSSSQPVPLLGSAAVTLRHTYAGQARSSAGSGAKITTSGHLALPDLGALAGLIELDVESSEIEAETIVDIETGTLLESEATMRTRVTGRSTQGDAMRFAQDLSQHATLRLLSGR